LEGILQSVEGKGKRCKEKEKGSITIRSSIEDSENTDEEVENVEAV
jgi:hypothetical protein